MSWCADTVRSGGLWFAMVALLYASSGHDALAGTRRGGKANRLQKRIERVVALYDETRFEEALVAVDHLVAKPRLTDVQRVTLLQVKAFALYFLTRQDEAKATWLELLGIAPDYTLDPVFISPDLVAFFGEARTGAQDAETQTADEGDRDEPKTPPADPAVQPEPVEAGPKTETIATTEPTETVGVGGAAAASDETEVAIDLSAGVDREIPPERGCGTVLCLVPFGVGQFANGHYVKGGLFLAAEVALLAANIILYWTRVSSFNTNLGYFEDVGAADASFAVQEVSVGLLIAAGVGGVLDAFLSTD